MTAAIPLAGIVEARGAAAPAALSFKNGYLMAIDEINAGGGVLGQQLVLSQFDIDTKPEAAEAAARKALEARPFAVIGPQFSGITAAAMKYTAASAVPHFTSGEAASLTRQFHPSLLRTSLSQSGSAPRMGALLASGLEVRKLGLIWVDNDFGRNGRAAVLQYLQRHPVRVGFDAPARPGGTEFTTVVAALKSAQVDALLLYTTETEAVAILKELRRQGFDRPIVADGLVASQTVIDGTQGGAEGVLVHMNNSVDVGGAEMQAFVRRYEARYQARPDLNSTKGFFAVQMIKAGLEVAGKVDQAAFLHALRNTRFDVKRFPGLLGSVSYDFFGDLNRASYFAVIRQSRPQILATIRSIEGGMVELTDNRLIALDSTEFRRRLSLSLRPNQQAALRSVRP